jgi:hypothetical protein
MVKTQVTNRPPTFITLASDLLLLTQGTKVGSHWPNDAIILFHFLDENEK